MPDTLEEHSPAATSPAATSPAASLPANRLLTGGLSITVSSSIRRQAEKLRSRHSHRRFFRIASLLLPLALFAIAESTCRFLGWGESSLSHDPFVEFAAIRPLFSLANDGKVFKTSPERLGFFREESFPASKDQNEFRIFVLGGSTVQGHPYSHETSFPAYLQTALSQAAPSRSWRVVNCGGVSYASYRLVPVLEECLGYDPDLIIFCGGHNEFLEDVTYAPVRETSSAYQSLMTAAERLRLVRFLRGMFHPQNRSLGRSEFQAGSGEPDVSETSEGSRPVLSAEVDTILNHARGLQAYHRDDSHKAAVSEHFRSNLLRMNAMCRQRHVPFLLIRPPGNLVDCPPFKCEFSDSVPEATRAEVGKRLLQCRQLSHTSCLAAIEAARKAVELDDRYAASWYELGQLQLVSGDIASARQSLWRACDEDVCPLRMTSQLATLMKETAEELRIPLLDAHELLEQFSSDAVSGNGILVDHVHPSFRGNEEIAVAITQWMIDCGYTEVSENGWLERSRIAFRERLMSLDALYFLKGKRRLEVLRTWAAGRANEVPTISTEHNGESATTAGGE